MLRRLLAVPVLAVALVVLAPGMAFACGGLVAPGHAEVLRSATTLAAWHNGFEHYVTGFTFAGSASSFGYIIPLPAEPVEIEKGGEWTLERLQAEVGAGPLAFGRDVAFATAGAPVDVLQQVRIEALDITVVRGGGADVADWAAANGFDLTSDTPEVLGRYSDGGSIFALARFDNEAAAKQGFVEGQGTVIHFTIPTPRPWIPLRILALGKGHTEEVVADLFVLTPEEPAFAPRLDETPGMRVLANRPADERLLGDLRSDSGMEWLPESGMWFTALSLRTPAEAIADDLTIDHTGWLRDGVPSRLTWMLVLATGSMMAMVVVGAMGGRSAPRPA